MRRAWRYTGIHRLTWVVIILLVLAVAVFAMAAGFVRLRSHTAPPGPEGESQDAGGLMPSLDPGLTPLHDSRAASRILGEISVAAPANSPAMPG